MENHEMKLMSFVVEGSRINGIVDILKKRRTSDYEYGTIFFMKKVILKNIIIQKKFLNYC
eukprot:snap_masked-scaffold_99-processed-gene-0.20-mRNA-1 protein AED:1.00 eAED:1.00 QI:0/-1/0/0/-1/1/1/0/59